MKFKDRTKTKPQNMKNIKLKSLVAIAAALICVGCVDELKEVAPAYNPEITDGTVKSVEFVIPSFVEEDDNGIQTKTTLTSKGFVWAEKDTVGIFPSKGNQIYYEMSSGAGSSSAEFDGGGWALKDEHLYSSYYPLQGNFYLDRKAIPVTYDTEVTQVGNNNSDHLGANAFMFAPETKLSNGKVTFKFWQLGSVLKPRVTLPAGTYTKLVLSTDEPIFVVSGKYDLTTGVDASSSTATYPEFVPVIVPETGGLTNKLTINLEDVTFASEAELIAYIMAAPVDVSNIPIKVTIYCGDSPRYSYEFVRTSSFVAQTNHNIRPNEKGLMSVANSTESANALFASGETSLSLVDVAENASLDLILPETSEPVNINMAADEGMCTMSVSYPTGTTIPKELNIRVSNGSDLIINTPESTVTLDGERSYNSVRAATASNTLIIDEDVTIGTLFLEKGNVQVFGEIMALNTDDLEEGETPTVYVYGTIQGQIDDDDVTIRRPITAVNLDQTSLELEPSETVQLVATAVPENAIYETITWTSSNTSVATVSDAGLVTAITSGECNITVDIDGKQATCSINVKSVDATDLSASGTANCYIVSSSGDYKFKTVQGNTLTSVGSVASAEVLWETFGTNVTPNVGDLVNTVSYSDGNITFKATGTEGNAVIAAKDASGNILWSWHIWCTDEPEDQVYKNGAGTMMDRNLGATSATPGDVGALGLLYQWGRKDPFLGNSSISSEVLAASTISWPAAVSSNDFVGTIEYAVSNPTEFIQGTSNTNHNWLYHWDSSDLGTLWQTSDKDKGKYDPCPFGWRVPDGKTDGVWMKALATSSFWDMSTEWDSTNKGIDFGSTGFSLGDGTIWYPASGTKKGDSLNGVGREGYWWSCSLGGNLASYGSNSFGFSTLFSWITASQDYLGRDIGYSVRCIKEGSMSSDINVSSVRLNKSNINLWEGDTETLIAIASPSNATNKNVSWESSDASVATVDASGKVTAVAAGTAYITVSWVGNSDIKATCAVTVTNPSLPVPEMVDLGLPSGLKWASFNLGATSSEEYGNYYQWGGLQDVTNTSINVGISNCPYHTGSSNSIGWTKYIPIDYSSYWSGTDSPDDKDTLDSDDDVVHIALGRNWRMPTIDEFDELIENCRSMWIERNGVYGRVFISNTNGKSIFLPAAGGRDGNILNGVGTGAAYWSLSLFTDSPSNASVLIIHSGGEYLGEYGRSRGIPVRPVSE